MNQKVSVFCMLGVVSAFQALLILLLYSEISHRRNQENQNGCWYPPNSGVRPDSSIYKAEIIYNQEDLQRMLRTSTENQTKPARQEFDFVLRLRKLVLYSVREVNLRIQRQECARWWANPLSVSEVKKWNVSRGVTQYELTFEIQPGRIPFRTVVNVDRVASKYEPEDLVLVGARRLDELPKTCGTVPRCFHEMCLCPAERRKAEQKTQDVRREWELTDPELHSWPPNMSMFVPDYIKFGTMDLYLKSPPRNAGFCDPEVKMILFVSSYPDNFEGREVIRRTYGNPEFLKQYRVKVLFAFDRVTDVKLQDKINQEFEVHHDLIQGNYVHSYHNLTLRDLSMFNWILTNCRLMGSELPGWFMKTDDDYFINIPLTLEVAAANSDVEVMGPQSCEQPVNRDVSFMDIYYTPKYLHAPGFYPGYLSGASWLIRSDVLPSLLKASLTVPFIEADDVYITGMLMREVGIRPKHLRQTTFRRRLGPCLSKKIINSNTINPADMLLHWKYFRQPKPTECKLASTRMKKAVTQEGKLECFYT